MARSIYRDLLCFLESMLRHRMRLRRINFEKSILEGHANNQNTVDWGFSGGNSRDPTPGTGFASFENGRPAPREVCMMAIVGRAFALHSDSEVGDASKQWTILGKRASSVKPSFKRRFSSNYHNLVFFVVLFAAPYCRPISAGGNLNFRIGDTPFLCSTNIICLAAAEVITGVSELSGSLSLLGADDSGLFNSGLVYNIDPVRLKDPHTGQSASFNTFFAVDTIVADTSPNDGFAFVISADNKTVGGYGGCLGFFPRYGEKTAFKSIIVEFDGYRNNETNDINDNHVSFDFSNINSTAAEDASKVNVTFRDNSSRLYAWIEYSNDTQQLEVRISNANSRPDSSLLTYTVDLSQMVEDWMWVGFSSGTGATRADHYIRDWTFESYGISNETSNPAPSRSDSLGLSVGISSAVLGLILAFFFMVFVVHRRYSSKHDGHRHCQLGWQICIGDEEKPEEDVKLEGIPESFSYKQLSLATKSFKREWKLGQGGFGSVHRGILPTGIPIAVKKINVDSTQGEKDFMAEVSIVSRLRHRNLIQLMGWCKDASNGNYLLVYDLMINGSLDKVLFGGATCLSWIQRFNIVTGTAAALDYLHQGWTQQVIHRDIKSSNIMLDENWDAKLGDFGLARFVDHGRTVATTTVAGTYGYIAPEVHFSRRFTDRSDVYAFGAVLLEVASGRRAFCSHLPEDEMYLVDWVWKRLSKGDLLSAVDVRLEGYDSHWMEVMLKIGLLCSHPNPKARPTMRHVLQILAGDIAVPFIPASKPTILLYSSDSEGHVGTSNIPAPKPVLLYSSDPEGDVER